VTIKLFIEHFFILYVNSFLKIHRVKYCMGQNLGHFFSVVFI
jgi:hypothetical protein